MLAALLWLQLASTPQVLVSQRAVMTLDSIAALAWHDGLEPGACVSKYRAVKDTIFIDAIEPGNVAERGSARVSWNGPPCGDSLPSLHGHLLELGHWPKPSPPDWILNSRPSNKAPFDLILLIGQHGVAERLIPYGVRTK